MIAKLKLRYVIPASIILFASGLGNAEIPIEDLLRFSHDFESVLSAAKSDNPFAIIYLLTVGDWTNSEKNRIESSLDEKKSLHWACEKLIAIDPGKDPELNYYCGLAWAERESEMSRSENGKEKVRKYPTLDYLEIAVRNGTPGAMSKWEEIAVWGGVRGISCNPERGYELLAELETKGDTLALEYLKEAHALHCGQLAYPYAIKYAGMTHLDKDALHAIEVLFRGDVELPLNQRIAKADSIAACMKSAGTGYATISKFLSYEDGQEALSEKYRQKSVAIGYFLEVAKKGDKFFLGRIEDLNLKNALEYYEEAIGMVPDGDFEKSDICNIVFNAATINWNLSNYNVAKSQFDKLARRNVIFSYESKIALGRLAEFMRFESESRINRKKLFDEALGWYEKAESYNPEYALYSQCLLYGWEEDPMKGFVLQGKASIPFNRLVKMNTFASKYYLACLSLNINDFCSAIKLLNNYFGSNPTNQDCFSDAIILYDRIKNDCPERKVYDIDKLVEILYKHNPSDIEANWLNGCSLISKGLYGSGLESMKKAIDLAMQQGKITDHYYKLLDLSAYYQGLRGVDWQSKNYEIPVKYRKAGYGKQLEKIAFANFDYDNE